MTHVYYKESAAACIVFDLTDNKTFKSVEKWKNDVAEKVKLSNEETVPMLLLGNKADIDSPKVDEKEINEFAEKHGFVGWYPCSAATSLNLDKAFDKLTSVLLEKGVEPLTNKGKSLKLDDNETKDNVKRGCCPN